MEQGLLNLLSPRKGHFRLASGYHGRMWLDLDPLFVLPGRIQSYNIMEKRQNSTNRYNRLVNKTFLYLTSETVDKFDNQALILYTSTNGLTEESIPSGVSNQQTNQQGNNSVSSLVDA